VNSALAADASTLRANGKSGWHQRAFEFLVRHRIRISVIVFVCLILEDLLERRQPRDLANFRDPWMMLGLALVSGGLALRSWAAGTLKKWAQLTTQGPYGVIRHPLYVGSFMMMIGFCVLINDEKNIYFILGPVLLMYLAKVFKEERLLAGKFGAPWQAYAAAVPRFIPRRLPRTPFAAWSLQQWLGSREYRALVSGLLGLVAVQLWRLAA